MTQAYKKISTTKAISFEGLGEFEGDYAAGFEGFVAEEKFDGTRVGVVKDAIGEFKIVSTQGKDRTANVPYLIEELKGLNIPLDTILDCEVVHLEAPRDKRWELSRSVMGTNEYDPNVPQANLVIFDCQRWAGTDLTKGFSFRDRMECIIKIFEGKLLVFDEDSPTYVLFKRIGYPELFTPNVFSALVLQIQSERGEGIMIKALDTKKYADWIKVKKRFHIDAIVIGAKPGKGKYKGLIGAFELGVYDDEGELRSIGFCSGMSDEERRAFTKKMPKVIEVSAFEITSSLKLRHPSFVRVRDDKETKDCKIKQLEGACSVRGK